MDATHFAQLDNPLPYACSLMKIEPCDPCRDLRSTGDIHNAAELTRTLLLLREKLARGELIDITQPANSPSGAFLELPVEGPWPGFIEHYFQCSRCPWRFRLAVDTLSGRDGSFEGEIEPYR